MGSFSTTHLRGRSTSRLSATLSLLAQLSRAFLEAAPNCCPQEQKNQNESRVEKNSHTLKLRQRERIVDLVV